MLNENRNIFETKITAEIGGRLPTKPTTINKLVKGKIKWSLRT